MEAGRRARHGEAGADCRLHVAGKTGTADKLVNGRYSASETRTRRSSASCRRASRRSTIIVVIDSPRAKRRHRRRRSRRRSSSASPKRRCATSASRRRSTRRRRCSSRAATRRRSRRVRSRRPRDRRSSTLADADPAPMPDLRGLSAREALRTLAKLGLTARMSGDGVVVAQDPPPGSPLERGGDLHACVLDRAPARLRRGGAAMTWAELHGVLRGRGADQRPTTRCARTQRSVRRDRRSRTTRARSSPAHVFVALQGPARRRRARSRRRRSSAAPSASSPSSRRRPTSACRGSIVERRAAGAGAARRRRSIGTRAGEMQVVGITGTNGKTTTAYLLASIFEAAGIRVRPARHGRLPHRRRGARGDAHDAGSARRAAAAARDGRPRAAAPARWKCRRTRWRCSASTACASPPASSPT